MALGTGQALDMGRRGDADVVFVHAKPLEEKFVAEGHGVRRYEVMYNDFVLIGPKSDPAKVAGGKDVVAAFKKIREAKAPFVSRGDSSGTHFAELELWKAGRHRHRASDKGTWYRETGQGMGPALNTAAGDERLYACRSRHVAVVQEPRRSRHRGARATSACSTSTASCWSIPQKHPHVKKEMGQAFIDWLISARRAEGDRRVQDQRRAAVLPERWKLIDALPRA